MLLWTSCTSSPKNQNDFPLLEWEKVPQVYNADGEPRVKHDEERHEVTMDENLWYSIVFYIVNCEENKAAIYTYIETE